MQHVANRLAPAFREQKAADINPVHSEPSDPKPRRSEAITDGWPQSNDQSNDQWTSVVFTSEKHSSVSATLDREIRSPREHRNCPETQLGERRQMVARAKELRQTSPEDPSLPPRKPDYRNQSGGNSRLTLHRDCSSDQATHSKPETPVTAMRMVTCGRGGPTGPRFRHCRSLPAEI
jgi:hypothetical protein